MHIAAALGFTGAVDADFAVLTRVSAAAAMCGAALRVDAQRSITFRQTIGAGIAAFSADAKLIERAGIPTGAAVGHVLQRCRTDAVAFDLSGAARIDTCPRLTRLPSGAAFATDTAVIDVEIQ